MSEPVDLSERKIKPLLRRLPDPVYRVGAGQWEACCPAHDDNGPSLSIQADSEDGFPLFNCFAGCDYADIRAGLLGWSVPDEMLRPAKAPTPDSARPRPKRAAGDRPPSFELPDKRGFPQDKITDWHDRLRESEDARSARSTIRGRRGLERETIKDRKIGWDGERFVIPVYDDQGRVVQVRRYDPDDRKRKFLNAEGYGGSYLYPLDALEQPGPVLFCEGELDALVAGQEGFVAVSGTGGAAKPPQDLEPLRDRVVYLVPDCDEPGRAGADKLAKKLARIVKAVHVVDLGLSDHEDVTDWFVNYERTADDLRERLAEAVGSGAADQGPTPVDWHEFWATEPKPVEYLVDPLIARGEVTRIYAQAKVGKSLLVQECIAALAMGGKMFGQELDARPVLYLDQENTDEDWKLRLSDMGYGANNDWSRFFWYSLQPWPPLDTAAGGEALLGRIEAHGAQVVVIDTQGKVLEGEEDKSLTSMNFYRHTLLPLKRAGVSVVIIDHAGNDPSKPRGTSGKRDDVDVVWQATVRAQDRLTLQRTHSRKRHARNVLYINRVLDPLRHEIASEDERHEERVQACIDAIIGLDPRPEMRSSARQVAKALKENSRSGRGWRDAIVREAWSRITGDTSEEGPS